MYVPFGRYANYLVTNTLPEIVGQTSDDSVVVGADKNGWTVQAYGLQSPYKNKSTDSNTMVDGGADVNYDTNFSVGELTVGAGYISNLQDAAVLTTSNAAGTALGSRVGGVNAHARFQNNMFDVIGSFVKALKNFASTTSTNNATQGNFNPTATTTTSLAAEEPMAMDLQAAYKTAFQGKPVDLGLGYAHTKDAGAYATDTGPMPEDRFSVFVNTNLLKNTAWLIQYSHDREYGNFSSAATESSANIFETEFQFYF